MPDQILTMPNEPSKNAFSELDNDQTKATRPAAQKTTIPPVSNFPETKQKGIGAGSLIIIIILTLIIGAAAAGAGIYFWLINLHQDELTTIQNDYQAQIDQRDLKIKQIQEQSDTKVEQAKTISPIPDISIQANEAQNEFSIKNSGMEVGIITMPSENNEEYEVKILKQTADNVYFTVNLSGLGGYILYSTIDNVVYRYNLRNQSFEKIFDQEIVDGGVFDISSDEKTLLISNATDKTITVYNLETQEKKSFLIADKYTQLGSTKFSFNAKKFAYSAAVGNPDAEESAIFIIDIDNNTTQKIIEGKDRVYYINNWRSNDNQDLNYYYFH